MIETIRISDAQKRSRRSRNIALGIVLSLLVVLFYTVTLVKFSGGMQ